MTVLPRRRELEQLKNEFAEEATPNPIFGVVQVFHFSVVKEIP